MKIKVLFIAVSAITLFAVQGYAQGARGRENHGQNNKSRSERSYSRQTKPKQEYRPQEKPRQEKPKQTYSLGNRPDRNAPKRAFNKPPKRHGFDKPYAPPTPPKHQVKKPVFKHHNNYRHHHYDCVFDTWSWFRWRGYSNRFIRHNRHLDRYFDAMLGYYLWGSFNAPTRIGIGAINFSRYRGYLNVSIGAKTSYVDLYFERRITFQEGYTSIEVITGDGYAIIHFYDDYGNSATYRM